MQVFLCLGSNQGRRIQNLELGIRYLSESKTTRCLHFSSVYETEPWGNKDQGWFLNQVVEVETGLAPMRLLHTVRQIERKAGRVRLEKWGPRLLDIDILLMGALQFRDKDLTIPHPFLPQRRFVLVPLHEIGPDLMVPGMNKSVAHLLEHCPDTGRVQLYSASQHGRSPQ